MRRPGPARAQPVAAGKTSDRATRNLFLVRNSSCPSVNARDSPFLFRRSICRSDLSSLEKQTNLGRVLWQRFRAEGGFYFSSIRSLPAIALATAGAFAVA